MGACLRRRSFPVHPVCPRLLRWISARTLGELYDRTRAPPEEQEQEPGREPSPEGADVHPSHGRAARDRLA